MSVWTTSTTGLETALATAIGSTIQQHTNTITNNLKGPAHILHIGNSISAGSVASNLHHLSHTATNSNFNVNQLQHHHHHPPPPHHHISNSSPHHNYNSKLRQFSQNMIAEPFRMHFNTKQSTLNRFLSLDFSSQ